MNPNHFDWGKARPLSVIQLLLATFVPCAVAFIGFHVVLPALVKNGTPVLIAWPAIASVMLLAFVVTAILFLRREARDLGISLRARMCLKKLSVKQWILYLGIAIVGLILISGVQTIIPGILKAIGFSVPNYMPFFLDPAINAAKADMTVLSPGFPLQGKYGILLLFGLALLLNVLTEELYFRAWMLPKLARFGAWSWVLNGALFAFFHTFQLWLLPVLLVASLLFAYICYKSKSIWPSLVAHLIGNFLLSILSILMLIAS